MVNPFYLTNNPFQMLIFYIFVFWEGTSSSYPIYTILDLNSKNPAFFKNQIDSWRDDNNTFLYECDGMPKMGMPYQALSSKRVYNHLPSHQSVSISIDLTFFGDWDLNDKFQIKVIDKSDNLLQESYLEFLVPSYKWVEIGCWGYHALKNFLVSIQTNHTSDRLKLEFFRNQSFQFIGIRDIKILLMQNPVQSSNFCFNSMYLAPSSNYCACPLNQYNDSASRTCKPCHSSCSACFDQSELGCLTCAPGYSYNGTACIICHPSCQTCFGSEASNCLSCFDGDYFSFDKSICVKDSCPTPLAPFPLSNYFHCRCPLSSQYYYERNNTCNAKCPTSSFNIEYKNLSSFCTFKCQPNQYYYSNGSCGNKCDTYYKVRDEGGYQYCDFPCGNKEYLYWNQSCLSICDYPFVVVNNSGNMHCSYPCQDYEYLYSDGTCKTTCDSPLQVKLEAEKKFCIYPCEPNHYLHSNGSCLSYCRFPLKEEIISGNKYCSYPCQTDEYLYWNGVCKATCNFPLQKISKQGKNYCIYPCSLTQYLYWNGSCLNSCEFPYRYHAEDYSKYCNLPCPPSSFLFINGSCINSCQLPLVKKTNLSVDFCERPCPGSNKFYYPDEKSCKISCPQPYILNETDPALSCILPLSAEEKKQVESVNSFNSGTSDATQGVVSVSVIASADSGGMSISGLTKILQYTKFLNITHSAKLELMFKTKNLTTGFIPFLPHISDHMRQIFKKSEVPLIFAKFDIHSSFLVNFWDGAVSLGILFGLVMFIRLVEFFAGILKSRFLPYKLIRKARLPLQNLLFTQFYNTYSDILMLSAVEIRTTQLDSISLALSFMISTTLVGIGFGVIYLHFSVLKRYQQIRSQLSLHSKKEISNKLPEPLENFQQKCEGMKVFFFNFKDISFTHQSFFLLLNLRNSIFSLVIGFLFDYSLFQVSLLTSFTMITVIYLFIKRPFKDTLNLVQQMLGEILLLTVNVCLMALASLDIQGSTEMSKRENLSQIIIYCNIVTGLVAPIFAVSKLILAIYTMIRNKKLQAQHKRQLKIKKNYTNSNMGVLFDDTLQNQTAKIHKKMHDYTKKSGNYTDFQQFRPAQIESTSKILIDSSLSQNFEGKDVKDINIKELKNIQMPQPILNKSQKTSSSTLFSRALRLRNFYKNELPNMNQIKYTDSSKITNLGNLISQQTVLKGKYSVGLLECKFSQGAELDYIKDPNKGDRFENISFNPKVNINRAELSKLKRMNYN